MSKKQFLSVKETADYFGVSECTVRRMIADREITFLKIRGQLKISIRHLEGWVDRHLVHKKSA